MPFDLRVAFTGICALVPDAPFDKKPSKVCVVLPFGEFEKTRDARDGDEAPKASGNGAI
jgi:hypothetical protein